MLSLKTDIGERTLKDEFVDVTLNELSNAFRFISSCDAETKRYLLSDTGAELDQDKLFEFKLQWVNLFSDFTIDELRLIPIDDLDSLSVDWLYNHCKQFLYQPESYIELKEFKHKGVNYELIKPLHTIGGAKLLFGNANYRQWMLASQLTNMANDQKNERGIESLKQLFALLYTDGDDSSEAIIRRTKIFGQLNALYGWSAYFFFALLVEKYNDYFHLSMTANPPLKVRLLLAKQQLRQSLSKTIFGRLLRSRLPKLAFSVLEI